ncbi:hypothetical protein ACHAXS_007302, partial [Conticribra weissflogii]
MPSSASAAAAASATDGNSPGSNKTESTASKNPSKDSAANADDNDAAKIKELIQTLISITPTTLDEEQSRYPTVASAREARRRQWKICREVLHLLTKRQSDSCWVSHWSPDDSANRGEAIHRDAADPSTSFIRTSLKDYNQSQNNNIAQTPFSNDSNDFSTPHQETTDNDFNNGNARDKTDGGGNNNNKANTNSFNADANQTIREALGDLPSATTSQLTTVLTKLLTQRIETSEILPGTQDSFANWEALGLFSDPYTADTATNTNTTATATATSGSASTNNKQTHSANKTAMTLTPLSLAASRLYSHLLGRHGAWGVGLVDIGGVSAISALVRRWCVECRGREPGGSGAVVGVGDNSKFCKGLGGNGRGGRSRTSGRSADGGGSGNVVKRARSRYNNSNSKEEGDASQPTRRSARINSSVSFMDCDDDGDDDYDENEEENAADNTSTSEKSKVTNSTLSTSRYNFQLDEDDDDDEEHDSENGNNDGYKDKFTNEFQMVLSGIQLAKSLSMPPLQPDYRNWSSEAKESYVEAASAALATCSALLVTAKRCVLTATNRKNDGGVKTDMGRRRRAGMMDKSIAYEKEITKKVVEECEFAVASLERALCSTVRIQNDQDKRKASTTPTSSSVAVRSSKRIAAKKAQSPQEEDLEVKRKTKESGIFLLRAILPMLTMKMELPNGYLGKEAAYTTVSNLVTKIIQTAKREEKSTAVLRTRLLLISSRSPARAENCTDASMTPGADHNDQHSQTPKQGGRKSISFSVTPCKATTKLDKANSPVPTVMQPPSLKKSITPKRTRFTPHKQSRYDQLQQQQHPMLTLLIGMLHKLFTSKGLERAETRSRICSLGILCLAQFPSRARGQLFCFVSNMCQSKVSTHRLLGVELIGEVLCQVWFWRDERNCKLKKSSEDEAKMSSSDFNSSLLQLSTGSDDENENTATTPVLLLAALHCRLTDKLPAVRTRAAMSFV